MLLKVPFHDTRIPHYKQLSLMISLEDIKILEPLTTFIGVGIRDFTCLFLCVLKKKKTICIDCLI